jgi:hypothetical protein
MAGAVGAQEPPNNATLAQLQALAESEAGGRRCSPHTPVAGFWFDVPRVNNGGGAELGPLDLGSVPECPATADPRIRPAFGGIGVAKWSDGDLALSQQGWDDHLEHLYNKTAASKCPMLDEDYELADEARMCPWAARHGTEWERYFRAGEWLPLFGAEPCRYRRLDAEMAQALIERLRITDVIIVGDSHARELNKAVTVFMEQGGCSHDQMMLFGTWPEPDIGAANVPLTSDVSRLAVCSTLMQTIGGCDGVVEACDAADRRLIVIAFGTWVAAYRTLEHWGQLLAAVREGLRDCRENNPRTWAANMVVWTEVKYRFEPDGFFATAARIERMNAAAYEQLGPLVDGWVDAFAMSKAMPEMSRDCNHWKQTADQMLFSMVLNKAEASPKFPHA